MRPYTTNQSFARPVSAQDSADNITMRDVIGNKADTTAGSSIVSLAKQLTTFSQLSTGKTRYVSSVTGDDSNDGLSPSKPKLTIQAAIDASSRGDIVYVETGVYNENITITQDAIQLTGLFVTVYGVTANPTIDITGDLCFVTSFGAVATGGKTCIRSTGTNNVFEGCVGFGLPGDEAGTAFDLDGFFNFCFSCFAIWYSDVGFDVSSNLCYLDNCVALGGGVADKGVSLSSQNADSNVITNSVTSGNTVAGFELVAGTTYNTIKDCSSGGGDGDTIDNGDFNSFPGFVDRLSSEQNELIYPSSLGEGSPDGPVTVNNSTTDGAGGTREDQNYWGDIVRIVPPDTITSRWRSVGIYIHAVTAADIQQWQIFFTYPQLVSAKNGGNDWDKNETQLTVSDGSIFEDGDFVWITGDGRADGEILKVNGSPVGNVVTIARETTADGQAGLRYDYLATPGNNMMYMVHRPDVKVYSFFDGDYSASGTRDHSRYEWNDARQLNQNSGMLMRMLNETDNGVSSFEARCIYTS